MGRASLKKQVLINLDKKKRFGSSRNEAKKKLREECLARGEKVSSIDLVCDNIFSYNTYSVYLNESIKFTEYCKIHHHEVKLLNDLQQYIEEYLNYLVTTDLKADSIITARSALCKLFNCKAKDLDFIAPSRSSSKVTKGRAAQPWSDKVAKKHFRELEILSKIGTRRHEALLIKISQISPDFAEIRDVVGKGGKIRTLTVLDPLTLKLYIEEKKLSKNDLLFPDGLVKRLNVHEQRRNYAQKLYDQELLRKNAVGEETKNWYCKRDGSKSKYDRDILQLISKNLGHERVCTAIASYLK